MNQMIKKKRRNKVGKEIGEDEMGEEEIDNYLR